MTTAPADRKEVEEPAGPRLVRRLLAANGAWTFAILLALVAFFSIMAPNTFLTQYDITQIATNAAIYLVLGVGMTYVIITGGIDLSNGSVLILSGVLAAEFMVHNGGDKAGWGGGPARGVVRRLAGDPRGFFFGGLVGAAEVRPPLVHPV